MNGKKAKQIRRQVYGDDYSPKFREYRKVNAGTRPSGHNRWVSIPTGQIVADSRRQAYQKAKKEYTRK